MWESITTFIPSILGVVMRVIQGFAGSYWLSLFLFALATKLLLFPLALKQQKSSAKMAAFQPVLSEINKTYANDKQRQQEELLRLQQEHGYSPLAGCLPLLVQMPILFGLIDVVYNPLTYIVNVSKESIASAMEMSGLDGAIRGIEATLISVIQQSPSEYADIFTSDELSSIESLDLNFFGMNLATTPSFTDLDIIWIIPILSFATMILSMTVSTKMSGAKMEGSMKMLPYISSFMFLFFGFSMPAGVTFYWIGSNLLNLAQSIIVRKIHDPEVLKAQFQQEIEEKRKNKKKKTKVVKVETPEGEVVEKNVSQTELEKIRLQQARDAFSKKYED